VPIRVHTRFDHSTKIRRFFCSLSLPPLSLLEWNEDKMVGRF
jgi:hypothetical protein